MPSDLVFLNEDDIKAAGHRIVVKLDPVEEVTEGGIVLARGQDKRRWEVGQESGVVVDLGPTAFDGTAISDNRVKVGTRVHFKRYDGIMVETRDEKYRIINDDSIFAISNIEEDK